MLGVRRLGFSPHTAPAPARVTEISITASCTRATSVPEITYRATTRPPEPASVQSTLASSHTRSPPPLFDNGVPSRVAHAIENCADGSTRVAQNPRVNSIKIAPVARSCATFAWYLRSPIRTIQGNHQNRASAPVAPTFTAKRRKIACCTWNLTLVENLGPKWSQVRPSAAPRPHLAPPTLTLGAGMTCRPQGPF